MVTILDLGKFGRIGNQLWQIAAMIGYATKHNMGHVLDRWYCDYTNKDMSRFFKHSLNFKQISTDDFYIYNEPNFGYTEIPFYQNIILHGYFQSEKYWMHCKDLIYKQFEPDDRIKTGVRKKYRSLLKQNPCAIHVRRGDYVNNKVHEICDMNYYNKAIDYIRNKTGTKIFIVFSDDIPYCKENFPTEFIFIENNLTAVGDASIHRTNDSDVEELFLMSLCKHNIIANSSFSWWAAKLNKNPNKIVIAPSRWFATDSINDKDLYTTNMIKI